MSVAARISDRRRKPVLANFRIVGVDENFLEELIDRSAEFTQRPHRAGEIFNVDCRDGVLLDGLDSRSERRFFFFGQELQIVGSGVGCLVLLFLDREDVRRTLDAGEQVRAVVGFQERIERFDAADDQRQIILATEREHGVDQVVTFSLVAKENFEAVGEEGEEVVLHDAAILKSFQCDVALSYGLTSLPHAASNGT